MFSTNEIVIVEGVRTAIGSFGGSLKAIPPCELGQMAIAEVLRRAEVAPEIVEAVMLGNVIHTEARDMYIARVAAILAGVPETSQALTVNRLCGSGIQAIVSAAQAIALGDVEIAVAAGAENMSRAGHLLPALRWGQRLGDAAAVDMLLAALHDPFGHGHMGITAENVAQKWSISREQQDEFACQSQARAASAIARGLFDGQIFPVEVRERKKTRTFARDEHVREEADIAALTKLRPAFQQENGTVTAGNASGINDGAAALLLMSRQAAERHGCTPMARLLGYAHAGVDPAYMGAGPIPAVQRLLARTGLALKEVDIIESNEAFAAQACAVNKALGLPAEKVNPNGGAIALGHPIGATGAVITVKLLHELRRTGQRYGIATMCIGGGQGIAIAVEAL